MKVGKKIAIAVAVCLCVVAISVGIYFGTKKKPQADKKTDSTTPVVNTGSDNLTPVTAPVSSGLLDSDSESDDDKIMEAFLKDGKGKFNKHLPGYCLNWKKKDQNKGDINYGKKTVAECKKVCFDKGPDGSDELTACEWGKGDINSTTDRANCIGHTRDINRYRASGHDNRICWTTAAPANHDDEKLYGKR